MNGILYALRRCRTIPLRIVNGLVDRRPVREVVRERLRLFQLLALAPKWMTLLLAAGLALEIAGPALLALATGVLVRAVTVDAGDMRQISLVSIGFGVVLLAQQTGRLISSAVGKVLAREIDRQLRRRIRELALEPDQIDHLESTEYQDELHRASDQGVSWRVRSPGTAAVGQAVLTSRFLASTGAVAVIAVYSLWLAATLLCMVLLLRSIIRTQWMRLAAREDGFSAEKRKVAYWTDLACDAKAAKEVRLFDLGDWIVGRRGAAEQGWLHQMWRSKTSVYGRMSVVLVLTIATGALVLLVPGLAGVRGQIPLDDLATYVAAAWGAFGIVVMGMEQFDIERGTEAVRAYDRIKATSAGTEPAKPTTRPAESATPPGIEFAAVEYRYPSSERPVFSGLDVRMDSGQVTAIVGDNGAGKTTMIKLLAGLYAPTAGNIRIDGDDLTDLDLVAWRSRLAVLFQDFIRYPLSAAENVTFGAGDLPSDPAAFDDALRAAGADELVSGLPSGAETPLSRARTGGSDLSGGQWQRLALARVLYAVRRGADLVVLDEPTAHLDVQAEARFYDEVISAVDGATVVLISHRMSTVRHADQIIVLDEGRIVETGDHETLLAAGGHYARMFELQASRFTVTSAASAAEMEVSP